MTSTNCVKVQNSCRGQKYHTFICTITQYLNRPHCLAIPPLHILPNDQEMPCDVDKVHVRLRNQEELNVMGQDNGLELRQH